MTSTPDLDRLADALTLAERRLQNLYRSVEQRQLYDASAWRACLDGITATMPDVEAIDPDLTGQLQDALGWLQTGDGGPPLPSDFVEGSLRLATVIGALTALTLPRLPWSQG
jgi:hypothetical protein